MVSMNRPKFILQFFSRIFPNPASFEFIAPAKQSSSDKIIWMNPHFRSTKIFNAQVLKWDNINPLNKRFWPFKFHCVKVVFISTTRRKLPDGPIDISRHTHMNILIHGLVYGLVYKLPSNLRRMTFGFFVSMCVCLDILEKL